MRLGLEFYSGILGSTIEGEDSGKVFLLAFYYEVLSKVLILASLSSMVQVLLFFLPNTLVYFYTGIAG